MLSGNGSVLNLVSLETKMMKTIISKRPPLREGPNCQRKQFDANYPYSFNVSFLIEYYTELKIHTVYPWTAHIPDIFLCDGLELFLHYLCSEICDDTSNIEPRDMHICTSSHLVLRQQISLLFMNAHQ